MTRPPLTPTSRSIPAAAVVAALLGVVAIYFGGTVALFAAVIEGGGATLWLLVPAAGFAGVFQLVRGRDWRLLAGAAGVAGVVAAAGLLDVLTSDFPEEAGPAVLAVLVTLTTVGGAAHRSTRTWIQQGRTPLAEGNDGSAREEEGSAS